MSVECGTRARTFVGATRAEKCAKPETVGLGQTSLGQSHPFSPAKISRFAIFRYICPPLSPFSRSQITSLARLCARAASSGARVNHLVTPSPLRPGRLARASSTSAKFALSASVAAAYVINASLAAPYFVRSDVKYRFCRGYPRYRCAMQPSTIRPTVWGITNLGRVELFILQL